VDDGVRRDGFGDGQQQVFLEDVVHVVASVEPGDGVECVELDLRSLLDLVDALQHRPHLFLALQPFEAALDELLDRVLFRELVFSLELPHINGHVKLHLDSISIAYAVQLSQQLDRSQAKTVAALYQVYVDRSLGPPATSR
jgi:hypothetical protein